MLGHTFTKWPCPPDSTLPGLSDEVVQESAVRSRMKDQLIYRVWVKSQYLPEPASMFCVEMYSIRFLLFFDNLRFGQIPYFHRHWKKGILKLQSNILEDEKHGETTQSSPMSCWRCLPVDNASSHPKSGLSTESNTFRYIFVCLGYSWESPSLCSSSSPQVHYPSASASRVLGL